MRDQLLLLLKLQKIDARVHEIRSSMEALPARIAPAQQDLARLDAMLQGERDRLADTEKWRKEQEELIALDEEALKKAKIKVQAAKTTKDYAAASREVDNKRRSMSEREDEVLKVIEALEKSRNDIEAHEKDVDTLRSQVREQAAEIQDKLTELQTEAETHSSGREQLIEKLDGKIRKRYERTMKNRGYAVAPVVDGICQGCHMGVPPQLNNIIARGETIEVCPRCHRLLYRKDFLDEVETGSTPAAE